MTEIIILSAALLPAIILWVYIWRKDPQPEPTSQLLKAVLYEDGKGLAPDITKSKFLYCFLNSKLFRYFKRIKFVAYGDEYKTAEVEYGAEITPEATPAKEGYTFSGWSDHAAWYMYGTCYGICTENTYHAAKPLYIGVSALRWYMVHVFLNSSEKEQQAC